MKILALSQSLDETNGWGRYSSELIRALMGLHIYVETFVERGAPLAAGVEFTPTLSGAGEAQPSMTQAVMDTPRMLLAAWRSDVIHALDETKLALAASLSLVSGRPFVATLHGSHAVRLLQRRPRIYGQLLERAAHILTPSHYTLELVRTLAPRLAPKLVCAPLGVGLVDEAPVLKAAHRLPFFLSIGSIKRRKGVLEALRAVVALRALHPEFTLQVAGRYDPKDGYVRKLLAEAEALKSSDALILRGQVGADELTTLLRTGRGLLMPSQNGPDGFEGFGLVHLEAAAHGMPGIGSSGCGNEEAIADRVTGYLVEQGDAASLNDAVFKLATDDANWDLMSGAAKSRAAIMTWQRTAATTIEAYRSALS